MVTKVGYENNVLITHTYKEGCEGKMTRKEIGSSGKVGTAAYISPFDNAIAKAKSKHTRLMKDGLMTLDEFTATGGLMFPISPLKLSCLALSRDIKKDGKTVYVDELPDKVYIQPKFDGHRIISSYRDSQVMMHTSGRAPIVYNDEIKSELYEIFKVLTKNFTTPSCDIHLDSEAYNHEAPRYMLTSWLKTLKNKHQDNDKVKIMIFDMIDGNEDTPYDTRLKLLRALKSKFTHLKHVQFVDAELVDKSQVKEYHDKYVSNGYEGIVIRTPSSKYIRGKKIRTKDALKYKAFYDDEFEIVGAHDGEGTAVGQIIFEFVTKDGIKFNSTPKMNEEERKQLWNLYNEDPSAFIGRRATVRYFSITDYGKPEFSNVICLRDDTDE